MLSTPAHNRLLLALTATDFGALEPHLTRVALAARQVVERPGEDIAHLYFVESGIVSVVAQSANRESIEAGLIGSEGVTGAAIIMGNHRSPHEAIVQMEGEALRIDTPALRVAMTRSENLKTLLLHFVHVFNIQVAHTALAYGRARIEERLARWLVMVHDRIAGDDAMLTHELIAIMLGVRRAGVTDALHEIEGKGLIRATRGALRILDREGLVTLAGGTYGVPETEYRRLIGEKA